MEFSTLDNYNVVELDANTLQMIDGGNPAVRKAVQWIFEQAGAWAIGEMCEAAWESFKDTDHHMSSGQRAMNAAHT